MKRIVAGILLIVLLLTCLAGCGKKVELFLDGGTLSESQMKDMKTAIASVPVKEGYVFAGWYADAAFTNYIKPSDDLPKDILDGGVLYAKWIADGAKTYAVRNDRVTVTDSGKHNQQADVVYLSDDRLPVDMRRAGFKELEIVVSMEYCELGSGQEVVYLYKNEEVVIPKKSVIGWLDKTLFGEDEDPSLLHTHTIESSDPVEEAEEDAEEVWMTTVFTFRVELSDLEEDLYLRYDASSKNQWANRNISVTVTPKK